ncbi:hypothetical protein ACVXHA_19655 [Escherichia coli]
MEVHRLHHRLPGEPGESGYPGPKQAGPDGERLRLKMAHCMTRR